MRDSGGAYNRSLGSAQLGSGFETWRGLCGLKGVEKDDRTARYQQRRGKRTTSSNGIICLLKVNVVKAKKREKIEVDLILTDLWHPRPLLFTAA